MKIRLLEQKLKKSGYSFHRYGQGSHRIYRNSQTCQTISICSRKGADVKPYQLKFLPNLERSPLFSRQRRSVKPKSLPHQGLNLMSAQSRNTTVCGESFCRHQNQLDLAQKAI